MSLAAPRIAQSPLACSGTTTNSSPTSLTVHSPGTSPQCRCTEPPTGSAPFVACGRKCVRNSSVPSLARPASMGLAEPAASAASHRCTAVSCAIRRITKPAVLSFDQVQFGDPGSASVRVAKSPARTWRYISTRASSAGLGGCSYPRGSELCSATIVCQKC